MKAINNNNSSLSGDEDGEMGIGMMIIFIAMVLVAAVAAAVIINTANDVREQAQSTGDQAIADVATGFNTQNILGDREDAAGTETDSIEYLEIRVQLHAGSPDVAMDDVLIELTDGSTVATMTFDTDVDTSSEENAKRESTNASEFSAVALIDDDGSFGSSTTDTSFVINEGDVIKIFVYCGGHSLTVNTDVEVRIIPRNGAETYNTFTTPDTYTDRYVDLLG
jgi:archaeal flagellin FlaB